jgi:hypothetical protein
VFVLTSAQRPRAGKGGIRSTSTGRDREKRMSETNWIATWLRTLGSPTIWRAM